MTDNTAMIVAIVVIAMTVLAIAGVAMMGGKHQEKKKSIDQLVSVTQSATGPTGPKTYAMPSLASLRTGPATSVGPSLTKMGVGGVQTHVGPVTTAWSTYNQDNVQLPDVPSQINYADHVAALASDLRTPILECKPEPAYAETGRQRVPRTDADAKVPDLAAGVTQELWDAQQCGLRPHVGPSVSSMIGQQAIKTSVGPSIM